MRDEELKEVEHCVRSLLHGGDYTISSCIEFTSVEAAQTPHSFWIVRVRRLSRGEAPFSGKTPIFVCERSVDGWACRQMRSAKVR